VIVALNIMSAVSAFIAAAFWLASTRPKTPETFTSPYGKPPPQAKDLLAALRTQSVRNAWGAVFAALAAILQGSAIIAGL
jgi:hypothetical protein